MGSGDMYKRQISTLAIRSMAKATYSTDNIGHYGLAFDYYTHFTSPIRRYPDMMVHRLLAHYLAGGKSEDKEYYERLCEHSSAMEVRAADAEAQQDDAPVALAQRLDGVQEHGALGVVLERAAHGVGVRAEDVREQQFVSIPVDI